MCAPHHQRSGPPGGLPIFELPEDEWGWIEVASLSVNGKPVAFEHDGTLLDVTLNSAINAGKKATFEMEWTAQVPRQIRRSGWMNKEGVEYSMTQWYPKLCEYDHDGWHTEPYIGREYHGIWGDYDVTIHLPTGYEVGGTGELTEASKMPEPLAHGASQRRTLLTSPGQLIPITFTPPLWPAT